MMDLKKNKPEIYKLLILLIIYSTCNSLCEKKKQKICRLIQELPRLFFSEMKFLQQYSRTLTPKPNKNYKKITGRYSLFVLSSNYCRLLIVNTILFNYF